MRENVSPVRMQWKMKYMFCYSVPSTAISLRDELLYEAEQILDGFTNLSNTEKISFILTNTSIVKASAKTCFMTLNK